jgi:hypothetical protein
VNKSIFLTTIKERIMNKFGLLILNLATIVICTIGLVVGIKSESWGWAAVMCVCIILNLICFTCNLFRAEQSKSA